MRAFDTKAFHPAISWARKHERQISAILRIRAQLRLVDQVAAELERDQARDRGPKLSPRIPTRKLLKRISGLYFIRAGAAALRDASRALRLFPRSHPPKGWKQAWEQRKPLILHNN